ncbi:MAG: hypothetical protein PF541_12645 [Prolixibacteraceae bacterium]|jgi:hypothetical protein|nr:hypothetical protein [Prolixibacteraceae bacterium]
MKAIIIYIVLLLCSLSAKSQNYFADYLIVGSSLTYIRFSNKDFDSYECGYDEFTWNVNAGIQLSKNLFAGLQLLNIYSSEIATKKDNYLIYGIFTQYNLLKKEASRLFIEASLNKGNYCTALDIPYWNNDLYYFGIGGGFDFPLKKISNLYLDLSFISYSILNEVPEKYSYTQYIIGLNYRFNAH